MEKELKALEDAKAARESARQAAISADAAAAAVSHLPRCAETARITDAQTAANAAYRESQKEANRAENDYDVARRAKLATPRKDQANARSFDNLYNEGYRGGYNHHR